MKIFIINKLIQANLSFFSHNYQKNVKNIYLWSNYKINMKLGYVTLA